MGEEITGSPDSPEKRGGTGKESGRPEKSQQLSHLETLSAVPSCPLLCVRAGKCTFGGSASHLPGGAEAQSSSSPFHQTLTLSSTDSQVMMVMGVDSIRSPWLGFFSCSPTCSLS